MSKQLRVISINFPFQSTEVVEEDSLATQKALFDFDVVVIRPPGFNPSRKEYATYSYLESVMSSKKTELGRLFAQGGVLVVILDAPTTLTAQTSSYSSGRTYSVNNYQFLSHRFVDSLCSGSAEHPRGLKSARRIKNKWLRRRPEGRLYQNTFSGLEAQGTIEIPAPTQTSSKKSEKQFPRRLKPPRDDKR